MPPPPVNHTSPTLEGLPKPFVNALRTLFDVLDDKGTGFVKFSDIEVRWQDDGTKGLPKGVIESLRKVTPTNGLLSFERFCAGLKICLLRNQMESGRSGSREASRPPSAPLLDAEPPTTDNWAARGGMAARALSMPQLPAQPAGGKHLYGPPKPPRVGLTTSTSTPTAQATVAPMAPVVDKAEIRSALHSWQRGVLDGERRQRPRPLGDAPPTLIQPNNSQGSDPGQNGQQNMYKKNNTRRREPRRHTLQNGIDYNMLKRMKQMEVQKDVFLQGLETVERARDWYLKQIQQIEDKMHYAPRTGYVDGWSEEERAGLERARILEVNRHLVSLTSGGELPLHMNLAIPAPQVPPNVDRLNQHNQFLTQELAKKNDRITSLEREKAALIRELFHTRAQTGRHPQPAPLDTTQYL